MHNYHWHIYHHSATCIYTVIISIAIIDILQEILILNPCPHDNKSRILSLILTQVTGRAITTAFPLSFRLLV